MSNVLEILTDQMRGVVESSLSLALHTKNSEVKPLHILWALSVDSSSVLNQILNKFNISNKAIELEIKSKISSLPTSSNISKDNIKLSSDFMHSLDSAKGLMTKIGDSYIAADTWLLANLENSIIKEIFTKFIDLSEFKKEIETLRDGKNINSQTADETMDSLAKFGIDLTEKAREGKLDPVIGRDEEIQRMMQILIRKTKNNPILIGEPGVGKTAIAEGLAQLIIKDEVPTSLKNKKLIALENSVNEDTVIIMKSEDSPFDIVDELQ